MKCLLLALAMSFFVVPASLADVIFKCAAEVGVIIQSTPCGDVNSVAAAPPLPLKAEVDDGNVKSALGTSVGPAPPTAVLSVQPVTTTVQEILPMGITDMQVLNNRRWGKPQAITRNREARAWHEYWQYKTGANGGRQLHFINGKLVDISNLEPAIQTVSLMPVTPPVPVLDER